MTRDRAIVAGFCEARIRDCLRLRNDAFVGRHYRAEVRRYAAMLREVRT